MRNAGDPHVERRRRLVTDLGWSILIAVAAVIVVKVVMLLAAWL